MTSKETLCSGCGATVTVQRGFLADAGGSNICPDGTPGDCLHHVSELPPVAIKPEKQSAHTPQWKVNKITYPRKQDVSFEVLDESGDIVCQTIMREVEIEKERIAIDAQRIKLFAAAPDMLAALKAAATEARKSIPSAIGFTQGELLAIADICEKAISKTEDFMEEARRTR